jgi:hypothetical protein
VSDILGPTALLVLVLIILAQRLQRNPGDRSRGTSLRQNLPLSWLKTRLTP